MSQNENPIADPACCAQNHCGELPWRTSLELGMPLNSLKRNHSSDGDSITFGIRNISHARQLERSQTIENESLCQKLRLMMALIKITNPARHLRNLRIGHLLRIRIRRPILPIKIRAMRPMLQDPHWRIRCTFLWPPRSLWRADRSPNPGIPFPIRKHEPFGGWFEPAAGVAVHIEVRFAFRDAVVVSWEPEGTLGAIVRAGDEAGDEGWVVFWGSVLPPFEAGVC